MRAFQSIFLSIAAGLLPGSRVAIAAGSPFDGATAHWTFEAAGQTEPDQSGAPVVDLQLGTTSSVEASDPTRAAGLAGHGNAVRFDRTQSDIMVPATSDAALNVAATDDFSVSLWVKRMDASSGTVLISKMLNAEPYKGWMLMWRTSTDGSSPDQLWFVLRNIHNAGVGAHTLQAAYRPIHAGVWTHLALLYHGSAGASLGNVQLYVNGGLAPQIAAGSSDTLDDTDDTTTTALFCIAGRAGVGGMYDGWVDDVAIWKRILTPAEVGELSGNGAVGYWNFDETGQTEPDRSGGSGVALQLGSTAGVDGADPARNAGVSGHGLLFDGADYVTSVADVELFNCSPNDAFTIAGWFKRTVADANLPWLLTKMEGSTKYRGWGLQWRGATAASNPNRLYFLLRDDNTAATRLEVYSDPLTSTQWTHIAVVYDGTAQVDQSSVTFYTNGVPSGRPVWGDNLGPTSVTTNSIPLNVGGRASVGSFAGSADEIKIWRRALTQAEIQAAMALPPQPRGALIFIR